MTARVVPINGRGSRRTINEIRHLKTAEFTSNRRKLSSVENDSAAIAANQASPIGIYMYSAAFDENADEREYPAQQAILKSIDK